MIRRAFVLAVLGLALAPGGARAADEKVFYAPLTGIAIEYWDRNGFFHLVNLDMVVEYTKEGVKVGNKAGDLISKELSVMTWEDFNRDNPAVVIKRVALGIVKADPVAGPHVKDVLIQKLLLR